MIETFCCVHLPVDEVLELKKNRIQPEDVDNGKRISIVTGIHGDELEGQYVCYELIRRIQEHPECLTGTVDVYPAMNPLGIDSITRGIPFFDLDMNRCFPGCRDGSMTEYVAAKIIEDIEGSDLCVDIHASNIYLTEIPQIRINELHRDMLVPLAQTMNVDLIWVHSAATVLEATLAHSLNSRQTPTLVVEMGVGMRITKAYCNQLVEGILYTMQQMGIWQGEVHRPRTPIISEHDSEVTFINAATSGIFVALAQHSQHLKKKDAVGNIVNPLTGEILDQIVSPVDGLLFTIREYPIVDEGSLIARILKDQEEH